LRNGGESDGAFDTAISLEELIADMLASAGRLDRTAIDERTSIEDLNLDSLTLVFVLSRVEAVCGVEFTTDDTAAVLQAGDVGELLAAVERVVLRSRHS
jgi:acyl carrier protein